MKLRQIVQVSVGVGACVLLIVLLAKIRTHTTMVDVDIPGVHSCSTHSDCVLMHDCVSINRKFENAYVAWKKDHPATEDDSFCLRSLQYDYGPCAICTGNNRCAMLSDCRNLQ